MHWTYVDKFVILLRLKHYVLSEEVGMIETMDKSRQSHNLSDNTLGEVKIADEVVAVIAGLATTETEGVASMAGDISGDIISRLSMKKLVKGVKVEVIENHVIVDVAINVFYDTNIPSVSQKIQDKVKLAIENMTGLEVIEVNVKVIGIQRAKV